jgi:hypothetical protein
MHDGREASTWTLLAMILFVLACLGLMLWRVMDPDEGPLVEMRDRSETEAVPYEEAP